MDLDISSHEQTKNGKAAFEALRQHYDGLGQIEKRLAHSYTILNNTHFWSERQYNFESDVTKLSESFEILKDNDITKSEREKVDFLLNGIQSDNQIFVTAKTTVHMNTAMQTSFQIAVDHLSELIGATFSNASNNGKPLARNVSRLDKGRGGRGGCGGQGGRGGRGGQGGRGNHHAGGKMHNGVDITDLTCNYTNEEWGKVSPEIIQNIRGAQEAAKANAYRNKTSQQWLPQWRPLSKKSLLKPKRRLWHPMDPALAPGHMAGAPNIHRDLHSHPDWRLRVTASTK
jgi:hypothetical protein